MYRAISQAISPLIENQVRVIALLEKISNQGLSQGKIPRVSSQERVKSSSNSDTKALDLDLDLKVEDWELKEILPIELENELTTEKSKDNITNTLEKLKGFKRKKT
jgi:hypothetical protein